MTTCKFGDAGCLEANSRRVAAGRPDEGISTPLSQKRLDGDPGVWAHVCIAKLLRDSEMRGVCRQRGLCYLR